MSDCSTQAMAPKEPPKTCGTCFYSMPRKYGHWTTNDLICLRHAVSTHSERHHVTECGWGTAGPRGWRPKEPPKTCGTCEWFAREPDKQRGGACMGSYDTETCTYHATNIYRCEDDSPWCPGWRHKEPEPLEQVAREMLEFIEGIEREYPYLLNPNRKAGGQLVYPMPSEDFSNQLRELGVSVDD